MSYKRWRPESPSQKVIKAAFNAFAPIDRETPELKKVKRAKLKDDELPDEMKSDDGQ